MELELADRILPVTPPVAAAWGRQLHAQPLPVRDGLIAATAKVNGGSAGITLLIMILQRTTVGAHTTAALAAGFGDAFWWSAALAGAALPLCLLLPGRASPRPQGLGNTPADEPGSSPESDRRPGRSRNARCQDACNAPARSLTKVSLVCLAASVRVACRSGA